MNSPLRKFGGLFSLFCLALFLRLACSGAWAAITITPAAPTTAYTGPVEVTASVPAGSGAYVQFILDSNANGVFDEGDAILQHFEVMDSSMAPPPGAMFVADLDGAVNASVSVRFRFFTGDTSIFAGRYLLRILTPTTEEIAPWQVNLPSAAQSISGQVWQGGAPTQAIVAVMDVRQKGYFLVTGADGRFTAPIETPGQSYWLQAFPLEGSASAPSAPVFVAAGEQVDGGNLVIPALPRRWQGRVVRSDTGEGVAFFSLGADRGGPPPAGDPFADVYEIHGWTDGEGYFDIPISDGCWQVYFDDLDMAQRGFIYPGGEFENCDLTVAGENVASGPHVLQRFCAFVTGRAENALTHEPLEGATFAACFPDSWNWAASGQSDSQGRFAIGVPAGQWILRPQVAEDDVLFGSWFAPETSVPLLVECGVLENDAGTFGFLPADRQVEIQVVQYPSTPLQGVWIFVSGFDPNTSLTYYAADLETGPDGRVTLPARSQGAWFIQAGGDGLPAGLDEIPRHRLDILEEEGNLLVAYPQGARRPYRVYGASERIPGGSGEWWGGGPLYPKDYGATLLGRATGTAAFPGAFRYFYIVTYDGLVRLDTVWGANNESWQIIEQCNLRDPFRLAGLPDGDSALLGEWDGRPAEGCLGLDMQSPASGIMVVHPDDSPSLPALASLLGLAPAWAILDFNGDGVLDIADLIRGEGGGAPPRPAAALSPAPKTLINKPASPRNLYLFSPPTPPRPKP